MGHLRTVLIIVLVSVWAAVLIKHESYAFLTRKSSSSNQNDASKSNDDHHRSHRIRQAIKDVKDAFHHRKDKTHQPNKDQTFLNYPIATPIAVPLPRPNFPISYTQIPIPQPNAPQMPMPGPYPQPPRPNVQMPTPQPQPMPLPQPRPYPQMPMSIPQPSTPNVQMPMPQPQPMPLPQPRPYPQMPMPMPIPQPYPQQPIPQQQPFIQPAPFSEFSQTPNLRPFPQGKSGGFKNKLFGGAEGGSASGGASKLAFLASKIFKSKSHHNAGPKSSMQHHNYDSGHYNGYNYRPDKYSQIRGSVCRNDVPYDGIVYGTFICPVEGFDYTATDCCGPVGEQHCCQPFKSFYQDTLLRLNSAHNSL